MDIIKEKIKNLKKSPRNRICVRSNSYGSNLAYFETLFVEAQKDFPKLKKDDVSIFLYAGERINHMMGIEFNLPLDVQIPDSYSEIREAHPSF